jgi:ADP-heptose:LPS heptosyltransferase
MKILVRAPNWLGDIVMARPAIATIRGRYPDAALTVAAPTAFAPLCAAIPGVDAVLPLPRGNSPSARRARADVIKAGSFDLAILLTNSFGTALDVWRAGVPERWGFRADWRGRLLTRAIERPRRGKTRAARKALSSSGAADDAGANAVGRPGSGPSAGRGDRVDPGEIDVLREPARRESAGSAAAGAGAAHGAAPADNLATRGRHHSEYYLALTTALGMTPVREPQPVRVPDEARARARDLLLTAGWDGASPLAAVAPGAAYGYAKRWPPDRFAVVVARLAARGVRPVLVGAAADRESARAVESALARAAFDDAASASSTRAGGATPAVAASPGASQTRAARADTAAAHAVTVPAGAERASAPGLAASHASPTCLNLVGATDLPALMGLFGQCAVVLSNDSGAMHLASAVGRPVVAVFGPTDDVATAPLGEHIIVRHDVWCRPCLLRECPIDHRCMRGVTPDVVFDALGAYAPFTS